MNCIFFKYVISFCRLKFNFIIFCKLSKNFLILEVTRKKGQFPPKKSSVKSPMPKKPKKPNFLKSKNT